MPSLAAELARPKTVFLVIFNSWLAYLFLARYYRKDGKSPGAVDEPKMDPMPYRDYVLADLRRHDGILDPHILVALDMRVFDVSNARHLYGPGTHNGWD